MAHLRSFWRDLPQTEQGIHEIAMGPPILLLLQRQRIVPGRAARPDDGEQAFNEVARRIVVFDD